MEMTTDESTRQNQESSRCDRFICFELRISNTHGTVKYAFADQATLQSAAKSLKGNRSVEQAYKNGISCSIG